QALEGVCPRPAPLPGSGGYGADAADQRRKDQEADPPAEHREGPAAPAGHARAAAAARVGGAEIDRGPPCPPGPDAPPIPSRRGRTKERGPAATVGLPSRRGRVVLPGVFCGFAAFSVPGPPF